jgi:hypothetical protein
MPLVRDSPAAEIPNGASIYSATAPTHRCRFLQALEPATEEVLATTPDAVQPGRGPRRAASEGGYSPLGTWSLTSS